MRRPDFAARADHALAAILSCAGPHLTASERAFFRAANPLGFILFGRNCESPAQLRALTDALRETLGRDCPILIDQEGGRVQRLRPPHWRAYAPMKYYGDLFVQDADRALEELRFETLRLAEELAEAGLSVSCAPVLDLLHAETTEAIGDRAFAADPAIVSRLGLSVCRNLLRAGITPVIKHLPGHGRAGVDSHLTLPRVDASREDLQQTDFAPFRALATADVAPYIWGMTAHILYSDIDTDMPVSISPAGISVIRNDIGFDGFLLSDDLDMKALAPYGDIPARAAATLKAGCDAALYCWADLKIMEKMAENLPKISTAALKRLQRAGAPASLSV